MLCNTDLNRHSRRPFMSRTVFETASILSDLYDENFARDSYEPFRIIWPQLRSMSGVPKLTDTYIKDVNKALSDTKQFLLPFNEFLLVTKEQDLSSYRLVPDRLVEEHLTETDSDDEDLEIEDDE